MLKHSYSNNILIVSVLIIFSDFVKHLFLYCTAPQNMVTWFWRFRNIHYYYYRSFVIIIIIINYKSGMVNQLVSTQHNSRKLVDLSQ